jgi:hypothetical protein
MDCRINAYHDFTEFKGINRHPPNFIFIDIDMSLFRTNEEFWGAADDRCKNIEQILVGRPTVLWSGNGVHICHRNRSLRTRE